MLRDSFFSIVSTVVRLLTNLVLFVVMAHAWGPEQFGVFMFPFTVAAILVRVVDYGFGVQVARDLGRSPARARGIVAEALGAKVVLVAPTVLLALVVACVLPGGGHYPALLALLLGDAIANSFALLLNVPLRAYGRFDAEARTAVVGNLALFGAVAGVVWAGAGPMAAAAAFVAGRCGVLALSWWACGRVLGVQPFPRLVWPRLRSTLKEGFAFGVHTTIGTLGLQADTLMIQHYLGAQAVGIYQAGMRLLLGALLVADALNSVYLAKLARTGHAPTEFDRLGTQMTRHLVTLGVMAFACTVAGSDVIVHLLFKDGYGPLVSLLPGFGLLMFIRYGGVPYGTFLTLGDRQGVRVAAVTLVLVLTIALNAVLIPRLGLPGALLTSAASHVTLYAVYVVAAWRDRGTLFIDRRAKALVVSACAATLLLAALAPAGPALRVQLGAALIVASVALGVTRAEWGVLSGRFLRPA